VNLQDANGSRPLAPAAGAVLAALAIFLLHRVKPYYLSPAYPPLIAAVEQAATIVSPYALPIETNLPVYVCRDLRIPIEQAWPLLKRFM